GGRGKREWRAYAVRRETLSKGAGAGALAREALRFTRGGAHGQTQALQAHRDRVARSPDHRSGNARAGGDSRGNQPEAASTRGRNQEPQATARSGEGGTRTCSATRPSRVRTPGGASRPC